MKKMSIVLAVSILITGCVSKNVHLQEVAEKESLEKQLTASNKELEKIKKQFQEYRTEKEAEIDKKEQDLAEKAEEIKMVYQTKEQELQAIREEQQKKLDASKGTYETLVSNLQQEIDRRQATIRRLGQKIQVELSNSILFPSGRAGLDKKGEDLLLKVTETLKQAQSSYEILVEGHTDDVKISAGLKNRYPSNWELSAARAAGVVRTLVSKGVDPKHIIASGRSEFSPVGSNDTAAGRNQNRRIEIILIPRKILKGGSAVIAEEQK